MKQYDRFGEYMFDLLFAPLKKGKRTVNQLYIFFKVIGCVFDGLKEDALRVRDETNVATASPIMLPIHGQDRNMPRLAGESVEGYRTRLAMKSIIAEKGGLKEGILYALAALGYEQSTVEPFVPQDPKRWAEFIIHLKSSKQNGIDNLDTILAEVNKVKEGSSKLYGIVLEYATTPFVETPGHLIFHRFAFAEAFSNRRSFPSLRLDGSVPLDGSALLNAAPASLFGFPRFCVSGETPGVRDKMERTGIWCGFTPFSEAEKAEMPEFRARVPTAGNQRGPAALSTPLLRVNGSMEQNKQSISRAVLTVDTMHILDGSVRLDGSRKLNADIRQEDL